MSMSASKAAPPKAAPPVSPEVPAYFPIALKELLGRFRAIDRLWCFLKAKKSSVTVDDMKSFKDLFDSEAFSNLLKLCPKTLSLDDGSTDATGTGFGVVDDAELEQLMNTLSSQPQVQLTPPGAGKARSLQRFKATTAQLAEHLKKQVISFVQQKEAQTLGSNTSNTKISNSSSSRNESGVKRKKPSVSSMNTLWKQLQAAGELPDGFSFSFGTASRGTSTDNSSSNADSPLIQTATSRAISDSELEHSSSNREEFERLFADDDGGINPIPLEDRAEMLSKAALITSNTTSNTIDGLGSAELAGCGGAVLRSVRCAPFYQQQLSYSKVFPPREPTFGSLDPALPALSPLLVKATEKNLNVRLTEDADTGGGGWEGWRLFQHQAKALNGLLKGQHLSLSTETSSGKSLVYNVAALQACLEDPEACALYLFPTKALAQDQLRATLAMCGQDGKAGAVDVPVRVGVCDGDCSQAEKEWVQSRNGPQVVLTNPDMLHHALLPNHGKYQRLFKRLRYVVVDEAHQYKGTFGAHIACVLRRLIRVCLHHSPSFQPPQFVCCSATIANPRSLFSSLVPLEALGGQQSLLKVDYRDVSTAKGTREFAIWNPALLPNQKAQSKIQSLSKSKVVSKSLGEDQGGKQQGKKRGKGGESRLSEPRLSEVDVIADVSLEEADSVEGMAPAAENTKGEIEGGGGERKQESPEKGIKNPTPEPAYPADMQYNSNNSDNGNNNGVVGDSDEEGVVDAYTATFPWEKGQDWDQAFVPSYSYTAAYHAPAPSDDADAMADFLRSCEDRHRQPVSWRGLYSDKDKSTKAKEKAADDALAGRVSQSVVSRKGTSLSHINVQARESPIVDIARLLAFFVRLRLRVLCFCGTRRLVEMVNVIAKAELVRTYKAPHLVDKVASYRGGYTPEERREIETGLFGGTLLGVCATCALELGVDVGSLDVTLHLGFPGSHSSLWQQAGRAGRGGRDALSVVVLWDAPVDQYFARAPDALLGGSSEDVLVGNDNPFVVRGHLLCAAHEVPLNSNTAAGGADAGWKLELALWGPAYAELSADLMAAKALAPVHMATKTSRSESGGIERFMDTVSGDFFKGPLRFMCAHSPRAYAHSSSGGEDLIYDSPSRAVNLRLVDPVSITLVDETRLGKRNGGVLDSMTYSRAFFEAFEGSVFYHQARQFLITKLDLGGLRAYCKPCRVSYSTTAKNDTIVTVLRQNRRLPMDSLANNRAGSQIKESQEESEEAGELENTDVGGEGAVVDAIDTTAPALECEDKEHGSKRARDSSAGAGLLCYGVVSVVKKVSGFVKRDIKTRALLEEGEFSLPPLEMETQACWIDLPATARRALAAEGYPVLASLHAANHALVAVASVQSLCDASDLDCEHFSDVKSGVVQGGSSKVSAVGCADSATEEGGVDGKVGGDFSNLSNSGTYIGKARMLLYDRRPGGLGICEALAAQGGLLLQRARHILEGCKCERVTSRADLEEEDESDGCVEEQQREQEGKRTDGGGGCPACLFDVRCSCYNENLCKAGACLLLKLLHEEITATTDSSGSSGVNEVNGVKGVKKVEEGGFSLDGNGSTANDNDDSPRKRRRAREERAARFRDGHQARGLFVSRGWGLEGQP